MLIYTVSVIPWHGRTCQLPELDKGSQGRRIRCSNSTILQMPADIP